MSEWPEELRREVEKFAAQLADDAIEAAAMLVIVAVPAVTMITSVQIGNTISSAAATPLLTEFDTSVAQP